jgi:predicted dienelactone hydrolase
MGIRRLTNAICFSVLGIAALLCAAIPPASARDGALDPSLVPSAPVHEQVLMLSGDPARPVRLQVTVFTPDGAGPFPLAVLVHGSASKGELPRDMPRYRYTYSAYYFLSRGYAVAMPMMRGFAGSGGRLIDHGCDLAAVGHS